ncbi:MAG: autotransporter domain-containing protein [Alphaproteobacteria bacterium]|nr:autotransporter domain-containing protein [Alphaproteobacteria bacterium]
MNKYLISFLFVSACFNVYALVPVEDMGTYTKATIYNYDYINFTEIKNTVANEYWFDNSVVFIEDFSDWQNWVANVHFGTNVYFRIKNLGMSNNGEKLENVPASDEVNVSVGDADNLYTVSFTHASGNLFLNLTRETDYTKIFRDSRGTFLENLRINHPNDKMLSAMDRAGSMSEINSAMNSSYHFNPIILTTPIKTLNRAALLNFLSEFRTGIGADVDYITSDKTNNYGGHLYFADKYKDLYFKIGLNLNRFSYKDNANEFTGMAYGIDVRARQYLDNFWMDGIFGISRINFDADYIYSNGGTSNNPTGMSEYTRFSLGYDVKHVSDFVLSPFIGMMLQKSDVMGMSDSDINLHTGLNAKYDFIMDGIKYEYGANLATDDEAHFNLGINVGFLSVVDNAGAHFGIDMFQDDFGTNYKFSVNANLRF